MRTKRARGGRTASPASPEPVAGLDERVAEEQIRILYERGHVALLANLTNSLILVVGLWTAVPHNLALPWLAVMYAVNGARLWLWRRHERAARGARFDWRRAARRWTVGTAVTGALWGLAVVSFAVPEAGRTLVMVLIAGMVAGASATMSSYVPAFIAFTAPAVLPLAARELLVGGRMSTALGVLALIFAVAMTVLARISERVLRDSVRLRFKNQLLVDELAGAQESLAQSNRQLEARVAERTRELQRALGERDSFVSVVSHELKTPLSVLKLNEQRLARLVAAPAPDPHALRRLFAAIPRQTARLERLVDDLLDLSRLSTDRMQYTKAPTDLREIVDEAIELTAPQLASGHAEFSARVEEGLVGVWDRARIVQVLANLTSNAVKYGKPPFSIAARRVGSQARIVVRDHGGGIPPALLQRLFEPFERGEAQGTGSGLGLGLYISERIVRAHDGSIRAENAAAGGAAFILELPLGSGAADRPAPDERHVGVEPAPHHR